MAERIDETICDRCDFEAPVGGLDAFPAEGGQVELLCDLCSSTFTSGPTNTDPISQSSRVVRSMCYIGNAILKAIASSKEDLR